jgi:hypothetical protein
MNATQVSVDVPLVVKLAVLNLEQYQAVFSLYGDVGLNKYDSLTKDKENFNCEVLIEELASLINKDSNHLQKSQLTSFIDTYYDNYKGEEAKLNKLTAEASEAIKAKNNFKKGINTTVATFTSEVAALGSESTKKTLEQRKVEEDLNRARAKRDDLRKAGKKAYLKGLVASVIDNMEIQYQEEVSAEAKTIIEVATALKADKETDDPKTEKGTKEFMRLCFPREKEEKLNFQIEAAKQGSLGIQPVLNRPALAPKN